LIIPLQDNFDLITNKNILKHSTDVLNEQKLSSLLEQLRSQYDFVFITTPSLHVCYDALIIGKHCDGLVYVKEDRLPTKSLIAKHAMLVNQLNKPILGIMITDVEQ
jgi:polysaccharide biosynthesis transport protein